MLKGIVAEPSKEVQLLEPMSEHRRAIATQAYVLGYVVGVNEAGLRIESAPEIKTGERILDVQQHQKPAEPEPEQELAQEVAGLGKDLEDLAGLSPPPEPEQEQPAAPEPEQPAEPEKPKIDPATGIKG